MVCVNITSMARARIRVQPPNGTWKADVTSDFTETVFYLPSVTMDGRRAVEIVAISGGNVEACLAALREHPDVDGSTVLHRGADEGIVQIQTTDPPLLSASDRSDSPLVYPLEVRRGEVAVDVIGTHDSISTLGSRLERSGVTFDVVYVQRDHEICPVLTERQREVVLAAVEHGYYPLRRDSVKSCPPRTPVSRPEPAEIVSRRVTKSRLSGYETPRQCSLTELADEIGVAKSTCSGMLQRAEGALVENFLGRGPTTPGNATVTDLIRRDIEG